MLDEPIPIGLFFVILADFLSLYASMDSMPSKHIRFFSLACTAEKNYTYEVHIIFKHSIEYGYKVDDPSFFTLKVKTLSTAKPASP